jgi:hypothetical protein
MANPLNNFAGSKSSSCHDKSSLNTSNKNLHKLTKSFWSIFKNLYWVKIPFKYQNFRQKRYLDKDGIKNPLRKGLITWPDFYYKTSIEFYNWMGPTKKMWRGNLDASQSPINLNSKIDRKLIEIVSNAKIFFFSKVNARQNKKWKHC